MALAASLLLVGQVLAVEDDDPTVFFSHDQVVASDDVRDDAPVMSDASAAVPPAATMPGLAAALVATPGLQLPTGPATAAGGSRAAPLPLRE